jgi:hypothetical protein
MGCRNCRGSRGAASSVSLSIKFGAEFWSQHFAIVRPEAAFSLSQLGPARCGVCPRTELPTSNGVRNGHVRFFGIVDAAGRRRGRARGDTAVLCVALKATGSRKSRAPWPRPAGPAPCSRAKKGRSGVSGQTGLHLRRNSPQPVDQPT